MEDVSNSMRSVLERFVVLLYQWGKKMILVGVH